MSKIRKVYFFDKKNTEEMISFLNNSASDNYINRIMFNPFLPIHYLLPLRLKFLPESYVYEENKVVKALITVAPIKCRYKKMEIQKLFFEEDFLAETSELVQFVVSKYKAMGATSVIVKVDDYLTDLVAMFINNCNFSQISYEKLWRIKDNIEPTFNKKDFRPFRNSDAKDVANLYNEVLLPHFRPLLSKTKQEFKESFFKGLSYYNEYKYVVEGDSPNKINACITIKTFDNENYIVDIVQSAWANLDLTSLISYAVYQIKKRKKKFGLFIKSKKYTSSGEQYENYFAENRFECVQNQLILTNSSAKVLRTDSKSSKYIVLSELCPPNIRINPVNKISD